MDRHALLGVGAGELGLVPAVRAGAYAGAGGCLGRLLALALVLARWCRA
jgi:hypothetical protein